jgi:hypothetical protein
MISLSGHIRLYQCNEEYSRSRGPGEWVRDSTGSVRTTLKRPVIVRNEYGITWITSRDGYVLIRDPYITIDYGVLIWINTLLRLRDISIKTNINI